MMSVNYDVSELFFLLNLTWRLNLNFKFKWLPIRSTLLSSAPGTTRGSLVFLRILSCLAAASDP